MIYIIKDLKMQMYNLINYLLELIKIFLFKQLIILNRLMEL